MKILFLGDIVGRDARNTVLSKVNYLKHKFKPDIFIVNIENAAGGRGVTPKIAKQFFNSGIDVLTTGNHIWDQREIIKYIQETNQLIRPANMPEGTPGSGQTEIILDNGSKILVINLMTNLFMSQNDFVFKSMEKILLNIKLGEDYSAIFIDLHGGSFTRQQKEKPWYGGSFTR